MFLFIKTAEKNIEVYSKLREALSNSQINVKTIKRGKDGIHTYRINAFFPYLDERLEIAVYELFTDVQKKAIA